MKYLLVLLYLSEVFVVRVTSFPSSAGACNGGEPAVGGSHVSGNKVIETGSLADGQVSVSIDGTPMVAGQVFGVDVGRDYSVTVTAGGAPIRGILIRSQCTIDLTDTLLPDDGSTQVASVCDSQSADGSVTGVTHTNSSPKSSITSILNLPSRTTISFDVTTVMANNSTHSIYYYTGYSIRSSNPICPVCGEGLVVGDRDASIPQPGGTNLNCGDVEDAGLERRITPSNCETVQILAPISCSCRIEVSGPPPTASPPTAPPPTAAPPTAAPPTPVPPTAPPPTAAPSTATPPTAAPPSPPTTPGIPPKKEPPEDDEKDDEAKLFEESDRGGLTRKRTLRGL